MPLTTDRARISFGVFASPPFQGKKQRAFRPSSARTPPGFSWREDFCSKAFHKPWPRFSPWLACARCTTGTGEQRWLEATFCFSPLQAAGDWLPPGAGSPRLGLAQHREMASKQPDLATPPSPWAAAAPAGAGRWPGWHQSPGTGSLRGVSCCQCGHGWGVARCAARSGKQRARVSVCVHGQTPSSSLCLGARRPGEGTKSKRISLKWSDAASKCSSALATQTSKYLQGHKRAARGVAEHHYSHICIKTIRLFISKLFCLQAGSESHWGQKHLQERLFARTRIGTSSVVLTSAHKISERKGKSVQEEVLVLLSMKYNLRTPSTWKGEKHFKKAPCAALLNPKKEDLCPRKLSTPLCKHRKRTGVTEEQVCLLCSLQYQDYPIQCHIQLRKGALGVIELL